MSTRQAEWSKNLRLKVLRRLGGKCKRCKETDWRLLQIDHKDANGDLEREVLCRTSIFQRILKDAEYAKMFQILCVTCHSLKTRRIDPELKIGREEKNTKLLKQALRILKPLVFGG